jgi:hypothetical protein
MTREELDKVVMAYAVGNDVTVDRVMAAIDAYVASELAAKDADIARLSSNCESYEGMAREWQTAAIVAKSEINHLRAGIARLGVLGREVVDKVGQFGETPYEAVKPIHELSKALLGDAPREEKPDKEDELQRLKDKHEYFCYANAVRYKALHEWVRQQPDEELRQRYFSIIANGTATPHDRPTYAQQFNTLIHKCEAYEKALENPETAGKTLEFWKDKALYELVEEMCLPSPAPVVEGSKCPPIRWEADYGNDPDDPMEFPDWVGEIFCYDYLALRLGDGSNSGKWRAGLDEFDTKLGVFEDAESAKAACEAHWQNLWAKEMALPAPVLDKENPLGLDRNGYRPVLGNSPLDVIFNACKAQLDAPYPSIDGCIATIRRVLQYTRDALTPANDGKEENP